MTISRIWLSMLLMGSTLLHLLGCSSDSVKETLTEESTQSDPVLTKAFFDLDAVMQLRIEGRTDEAIEQLRLLNEKFPSNPEILLQLARSLVDVRNFPLAAFRFEQALSILPEPIIAKEAAEAHYLAKDHQSALQRYALYLSSQPEDPSSKLRYARLLAKDNQLTKSLNTFSEVSDHANAEDCVLMGSLFLRKKLIPQAKHWFGEASNKAPHASIEAKIGLLRIAQLEKSNEEAEKIILEVEKLDPGILETTDLANFAIKVLRERRLADFIALGVDIRNQSVSNLASALLTGDRNEFINRVDVITASSKIPPSRDLDPSTEEKDFPQNLKEDLSSEPSPTEPKESSMMSLADAFAAPIGQIDNATGAINDPLSLGQQAFLEGSYTSALLHARDAIKDNPKDSDAWQLCSHAHFQLGETNQAEMTILESIRHDPFNLDKRMDYLRIARETLPGKRYLVELEKVRELFPNSIEILWELARRYHIVENMPVTAAVLYRKVVQIAPANSALSDQAKMELIKLAN